MFRDIEIQASDTAITESEVTQWISEADAIIEAKLKQFYYLPITGASSLLIVGKISTLLVAHTIKTVLELRGEYSDKEQEVQTNLEKKAMIMLNDLLPQMNEKCCSWNPPKMPLPDANMKEFPPISGSVISFKSSNTATIKKGGDNW